MLPNFLIIGAPKAATTWIADALREHPDVFVPQLKELRYFCGQNYDKGRQWYEQHFADARAETAVGEASPSYLGNSDATDRIRRDLGDIKLIASLRHPVEQAYSFYWHQLTRGQIGVDTDFRSFFEKDRPRAGYYGAHLERYLRTFDAERMLVLLYETEIERNPRRGLQKCYEFLGVSSDFEPSVIAKRSNAKRDVTALHGAAALSRRVLKALPRSFSEPIKRRGKAVLNRLPKKQQTGKLDPALRKDLLHEYYRDDIKTLQSVSGLDVSVWYDG